MSDGGLEGKAGVDANRGALGLGKGVLAAAAWKLCAVSVSAGSAGSSTGESDREESSGSSGGAGGRKHQCQVNPNCL